MLFVTCIYFYVQNKQMQVNQEILLDLTTKYSTELTNLKLCEINRSNEIRFNGKILDKNSIVTDEKGNKRLLSEIIKGSKLILRYSDLNCNTCIDEQINNLNKNIQQIGDENIILLTTYENYVYMQRFRKANRIKFAIYNVDDNLNNEIGDIGMPYYFILCEDNFRISNMFIGMREIPELTTDYLESIEKKYFMD